MTSLAAQRVGLGDRGLLAPGMAADITIFDANTVADRATFERPHQPSVGFAYVFVNRSEEHTSELQSQSNLVCRLLLEKKKKITIDRSQPLLLTTTAVD